MLFEVEVVEHGRWAAVSVVGELDVATAPRLRQEAVGVVSNGIDRLALDLSGCSFLDSTGLGVIVGLLKRLRNHEDGALVIVGAPGQVQKVFDITRVASIVPLVDTMEEARALLFPEGT